MKLPGRLLEMFKFGSFEELMDTDAVGSETEQSQLLNSITYVSDTLTMMSEKTKK